MINDWELYKCPDPCPLWSMQRTTEIKMIFYVNNNFNLWFYQMSLCLQNHFMGELFFHNFERYPPFKYISMFIQFFTNYFIYFTYLFDFHLLTQNSRAWMTEKRKLLQNFPVVSGQVQISPPGFAGLQWDRLTINILRFLFIIIIIMIMIIIINKLIIIINK